MPSKIRKTAQQCYEQVIADYRRIFPLLSVEEQNALREIEQGKLVNRVAEKKNPTDPTYKSMFEDSLREAAETLRDWRKDGIVNV